MSVGVPSVDSLDRTNTNSKTHIINTSSELNNQLNKFQVKGVKVDTIQTCECDRGHHGPWAIQQLGQNSWEHVSKSDLSRLQLKNIGDKCQELVDFMEQQNQHTGFIPLSPLQFKPITECKKCIIDQELCKDPVALYRYVKSFGSPNFLGARVQVNHTMNLELLDVLAKDYWDWQLPLLLRYGFPMDFKGNSTDLENATVSHSSALQFPEHVTAYLKDELHHNAMYGPFDSKPFGEFTHVSPFITRHKPDSNKRRVIIDLSWPDKASVNHFTSSNCYLGTAFKLHYPSIDTYTDRLRKLGRGALMHKIDLSRAFRQLRVDPCDFPLLCLQWQDHYYVDASYAFGHRTGSMACSRLSDFLRYVHAKHGFYTMSYVDDLLGAEVHSKAESSFKSMVQLSRDLNIPISQSKLTPPTTKINCLGIEVDSVQATLSVPGDKLQEILQECKNFKNKKYFSKRQLQSIIGKLMFIHKVVKPARLFVNRLLYTLRTMGESCKMSRQVEQDINWFCVFVEQFNGTCQYIHPPVLCMETIELDACLTGLGACYNSFVYHYQFKEGEMSTMLNITHIEMWNVLVALKVWGHLWARKSVTIKCDNQAVVSVVNTGVTKDNVLSTMAQNIWLETASSDIKLTLVHIPGKNNECADLLSRWHMVSNNIAKLSKYVYNPVWCEVKAEHLCLNLEI